MSLKVKIFIFDQRTTSNINKRVARSDSIPAFIPLSSIQFFDVDFKIYPQYWFMAAAKYRFHCFKMRLLIVLRISILFSIDISTCKQISFAIVALQLSHE